MSDNQEHSTARAVWKFPLPFPGPDVFTITMPMYAHVLSVQIQYSEPQIWALVNPSFPMSVRRFRIAGTGHPISEMIDRYVGTFQIASGSLVFHIFEIDDAARPPAATDVSP